MKLYISADIEGIAGVINRDQGGPTGFEYDKGREWMTGEVRAACEAAFEKGATDIVISDSHGNGQNLLMDELPDVDFKHRLPVEMLDYLPIVKRTSAYTIEYKAADMLDVARFVSFITQYDPTCV
jgi:D-aminopeptidase